MTVRTDVTVNYSVSPRIITVALPSVVITIQDLHDTLQEIQDELHNLTFLNLLRTAGKEDLGGGEFVGLTLTLQNAKLAFAARPGPTVVQCSVAGGNLVAVDSGGSSINPIEPTAFTQVVVVQSTSPTLIETGISGLTPAESAQLAAALSVSKFLALR